MGGSGRGEEGSSNQERYEEIVPPEVVPLEVALVDQND